MLASCLCSNLKLTHLDLSYNKIAERACLLLVDMMGQNKKIKQLNLDGNPLGPLGCRTLVKYIGLMKDDEEDQQLITVNHCNFEMTSNASFIKSTTNAVFDELDPNGDYRLVLDQPYDKYVAEQLVRLALEAGGECWDNEKLNGSPFQLNEDATIEDIPYLLPNDGVLEVTFRSQKDRPLGHMSSSQLTRIRQSFGDGVIDVEVQKAREPDAENWLYAESDAPRNAVVLSAASRGVLAGAMSAFFTFDAKDVVKFLKDFEGTDRSAKVKAAAQLYTQIAKSEDIALLLAHLSALERMQVQHILGSFWAFNPANPTGHYVLNLGIEVDRQLAQKIFEINNRERLQRIQEGKPDLSQKKNMEQIRNERYNDEDFVFATGYVVPTHGKLEFDYCSSERPPSDAEPVDEKNFAM